MTKVLGFLEQVGHPNQEFGAGEGELLAGAQMGYEYSLLWGVLEEDDQNL